MAFYKDDPALQTVPLAPSAPIPVPSGAGRRLAQTYNRIGGLMSAIARRSGASVESALAVWQAESGGEDHIPGKPVLRFENHKFFKHWGQNHTATFDQHFQFGGRGGVPGRGWENHKWRRSSSEAWQRFHGNQDREYEVFAFAESLGGTEAACLSSSFGGPQILGSNYKIVGYASAEELFQAMKESERWEVCAFFDFCKSNNIIDELKKEDWLGFAEVYNGSGQAPHYAAKIEANFNNAHDLPIPPTGSASAAVSGGAAPAVASEAAGDDTYLADFIDRVSGWGLKHFKAYELLTMGHQHSDAKSPAYGLNRPPPREKWNNIKLTIQVLDELRQLLGAPIVISSVYRSPEYNKAIAGAGSSQHMEFNAIDFSVRAATSPSDWAAALKQLRANGRFKGGIGIYSTFVHLDTRGTNVDW